MSDKKTRTIWAEDECTTHDPDHETLEKAYLRIYGEKLDYDAAVSKEDHGDGVEHVMPNGAIVWASFPGGSQIDVPADKVKTVLSYPGAPDVAMETIPEEDEEDDEFAD